MFLVLSLEAGFVNIQPALGRNLTRQLDWKAQRCLEVEGSATGNHLLAACCEGRDLSFELCLGNRIQAKGGLKRFAGVKVHTLRKISNP